MSDGPTRLYVGRLAPSVTRDDLADLFKNVGVCIYLYVSDFVQRLVDVRVLNGFGFVEFDDPRDADYAVRVRTLYLCQDFDGSMFMGDRILVQPAKQPPRRDRDREFGRDDYGRGPRGRDPYGGRDRPRGPRRGQYRLIVFNLPEGTSWQDLKDVGREYGHVTFSDINPARPDEGALEFEHRDDYERALARIEGTELRGMRLRVEPDGELPPPPPPSYDRRERSPDAGYRDDRYRDDRYRDDRYRDDRYRDERPPPPMREDDRWRDERDERDERRYDREPPRDEPREEPPRDDARDVASEPPRDDIRDGTSEPPRDEPRDEPAAGSHDSQVDAPRDEPAAEPRDEPAPEARDEPAAEAPAAEAQHDEA